MNIQKAFGVVGGSALGGGFIGGLIGWVLGVLLPDYYLLTFGIPREAKLKPDQAGLGLGLSQGILAGLSVGLIIVMIIAWHDVRMAEIDSKRETIQQ